LPAELWSDICALEAIPPQAGIGARLGTQRIALFRFDDRVYALDDREPESDASVMSRGLLGDVAGEAIVISPLYKQRFRLRDGMALDRDDLQLRCWPVRIVGGRVLVASAPLAVEDLRVAEAS
ncbi:nitrite reductase small subunit NirD, partial [Mixta calida]